MSEEEKVQLKSDKILTAVDTNYNKVASAKAELEEFVSKFYREENTQGDEKVEENQRNDFVNDIERRLYIQGEMLNDINDLLKHLRTFI